MNYVVTVNYCLKKVRNLQRSLKKSKSDALMKIGNSAKEIKSRHFKRIPIYDEFENKNFFSQNEIT